MKFIYVFKDEDREKMTAMGYQLIKDNPTCGVSIFKNKDELKFEESKEELASSGVEYAASDVLSF